MYNLKVQGVDGSRDEGNTQRNAQNTKKKKLYSMSVKKALHIIRKLDLYL